MNTDARPFVNEQAVRTVIWIIMLYRNYISPYLPGLCRYTPTCSEYALVATSRFGVLKGIYLSLIRLMKCRPYGGSGYDPVPYLKSE